MIDKLLVFVMDESKWLTISMSLAVLAITILLYRLRHSNLPVSRRILAAMNLFFGVTIGIMALGHTLAVTAKLSVGASLGRPVLLLYLIGIVVAVPSWWLIIHTRRLLDSDKDHGKRTLVLNAWLFLTLAALGLHNLPLAAPALFNIGYQLHSRRVVGWVIVSVAILFNLALFIGSLIFFLSGQNFEQFTGVK